MDRENHTASIRDVSKLAGVSVATVSRVIHQNGRFSAETERQVRKAMEQLNYRPNRMAQGLRMKVMPIIGILVPDVLDEHYALMIHAVQEQLLPRGYLLQVFNTRGDGALAQQFIDMMLDHNAYGLIYVPDCINTQVSLGGLPTIFLERKPCFTPDADWMQVSMDNEACGREAAQWLLSLECKRILMIGDKMGISSQQMIMTGVLEELNAAGFQPIGTLRVDPQRTTEAIAALDEALSAGLQPDAILCTTSRLTIGALQVMKSRGIGPDQMTVMGIGEHRLHRYGLIEYKAVREPLQEMAEAAALSLLDLHDNQSLSGKELSFRSCCLKD